MTSSVTTLIQTICDEMAQLVEQIPALEASMAQVARSIKMWQGQQEDIECAYLLGGIEGKNEEMRTARLRSMLRADSGWGDCQADIVQAEMEQSARAARLKGMQLHWTLLRLQAQALTANREEKS